MASLNAKSMMQNFFNGREHDSLIPLDVISRDSLLSPREKQIITMLAVAVCPKDIAEKIGISRFTVNQHLRSIYSKLGAQGRLEAILAYRKHLRTLCE